ncbi:UDP-N-acetylglucosamine--dolichyl-phosphate N-acetylglucosaminephosphotransferase [Nematocida sp. AWRm80]|nr:UDP-N-acetylglucosamine--dolichyl-phosphate N-acetylglucosaminephosphotransferase [Nematocida sp. AWRm80]
MHSEMIIKKEYILRGIYANSKELSLERYILLGSILATSLFILSYSLSLFFIRKTRIFGVDYHKKDKKNVPEGIGIGCGLAFITGMFMVSLIFPLHRDKILICSGSIIPNILLGYIDDTMDLSWGVKLVFPMVAIIPMISTYSGSTYVQIPFYRTIDLGVFFYLALFLLSVYFTNTINILSGINGIECGQVLVISVFIAVDKLIFAGESSGLIFLLSLILFGCVLALFLLNAFPSRCFVGDTFCYFAGSTLLCLGILGGCTKTIFLFLLPQLVNFGLSFIQIIGIIPCPRHRMPETQILSDKILVCNSYTRIPNRTTRTRSIRRMIQKGIISVLESLRLIRIEYSKDKEELTISNLTLLNTILLFTGSITEHSLCNIFMAIQVAVCICVIFIKILLVYVLQ